MIGLLPYQTWDVLVRHLPEPLAQWVPHRIKVEMFYIFTAPAAHAEYTATSVIPAVGAVADIKRLPCHISQFAPYISQGAKISSPTRVNVGSRHFSETVTGRKLKFYTHIDRSKYSFKACGACGRCIAP